MNSEHNTRFVTKTSWKPGQCGNPRGRPKLVRDLPKLARTFTRHSINTLARIMRDETAPHMARIKAAEVLLNRGWGQAPQTITLTDESAAPVDVLELARRVAYLLAFAERQAQAEDAELLPSEEEKEQT